MKLNPKKRTKHHFAKRLLSLLGVSVLMTTTGCPGQLGGVIPADYPEDSTAMIDTSSHDTTSQSINSVDTTEGSQSINTLGDQ